MMEVMKYVVNEYERRGDVFGMVAMLYTTSPLTDPEDLKKACRQFEEGDIEKAILAVTPFPAPVEHAFRLQDNGDLVPHDEKSLAKRTQDLPQDYQDAAMFAIYSADYIKSSHKAGDYKTYKGYEVPSYRVTDIDWPEDWERAEALYKALTASTRTGQKT
jgi:CMP-N-acetylneuraminic acid synthetase